jgi:TonB family protein
MVLRITFPQGTPPPDENLIPRKGRDEDQGGSAGSSGEGGVVAGRVEGLDTGSGKKVVVANLAQDSVLQEIVHQARLAAMATGAFVAVVRSNQITAQATSGSNASQFVAYLNRDQRVVDSCLEASAVQRFRNSESSPELDGSTCRYLGARSIVLLPILNTKSEKLGVFGVFSPQFDAFSDDQILALQSLSQRAADRMAQMGQSSSFSSNNASVALQSDAGKSSPTRTQQSGTILRRLAAIEVRPVWGVSILVIVLLLGWLVSRALTQKSAPASENGSPVVAAPQASTLPAQPVTELTAAEQTTANPAAANSSSSPAAGDTTANSRPSPAVAAVVKPDVNSDVKSDVKPKSPAAKISAPAAAAVKPVKVASTASRISKKATSHSGNNVPDLEIENALDDASAELPAESVNPTKALNQPGTGTTSRSTEANKKIPSTNAGSAAASTAASALPPREAVHLFRDPGPTQSDTPHASISSNIPGQNAGSANAGSPPSGPIMIPENAALARIVEKVKPDYPEDAKAQHVQGNVTVDAVVGKDGGVTDVTPIDGDPRLLPSAVKAVRQWHFAPLLRDSHFVVFETHLTVQFVLP